MPESSPYLDCLLLDYVRARPQTIIEVRRIASEVLSDTELKALSPLFTAGTFEPKPGSVEEKALLRLKEYFAGIQEAQTSDGASTLRSSYSLAELHLHAVQNPSKTAIGTAAPGQLATWLFTKDLCSFIQGKIGFPKANFPYQNLNRLLSALYGERPISNPVAGAPIKKVVDLYQLTERDLKRFAYERAGVPCGPKTFQALETILMNSNLPTLNQVLR